MANIICFGDSITRGENDVECGGWVDRLKQYCIQEFIEAQENETCVFNMGIGGETTEGLIKRFQKELDARLSVDEPNILTLAYGANDIALINGENTVKEDRFYTNLSSCLNYALERDVKVFLINILPFIQTTKGDAGFYGKVRKLDDAERYNKRIKAISDENSQVEHVDLFSLFSETQYQDLLTYDGIHPNAKGHALIYEKMKSILL